MSKSEKILMVLVIIIAICLAIIIGSGNVQIIIVVGDKLVDRAKTVDWKTVSKIVGYLAH